MKRTDKIILYSIFYIPAILLLCYFFWSVIFGKSTSELKKEDNLNEGFAGKIETLYFDKQNHNVKIALLSNGYKYEIFRQWEPKIQVGDSISKKKGSFKVIIYKGNNISILDYRDTYRK